MQSEYAIDCLTQERDHWKHQLEELLNAVHRDGGQYTILVGHQASQADAIQTVQETYRKKAALSARIGQLIKR